MKRRAARLAAVEVLYAADVRGVTAVELLDADRPDVDAFCRGLVDAVSTRRDELDALIGSHARGWSLERMSVVDRNVLRLGVLELLSGDVPAPAVIDEAVEIAKRFSGDDAGRFVNGVLDAVRQAVGGASSVGDQGSAGDDGPGGGSSSEETSDVESSEG